MYNPYWKCCSAKRINKYSILYSILKVHRIEIFLASILKFVIFLYFYVKILRFCTQKKFIGPVLGEVRFFHVVLRLRGMKKNFELGQTNIFSFFIYEPFLWANTSFSKIRSITCVRDGFMCWSWAKMSKFILLSLRIRGIEFSLVSD